jgi:tetratricopeptide (TPR) repeat protein
MQKPSLQRKALRGRFYFLFSAFCFFPLLLSASIDVNSNCLSAYRSILSFRFTEARQKLAAERLSHPTNVVPEFLDNWTDFLVTFSREERPLYDKFRKDIENRVQRIRKDDEHSPYYHYFLGCMYLQSALVKTKFNDYTAAALDYNRAYHDYQENISKYRGFIPQYAGLGLIHILAGVTPDNYSWVMKLFGITGDVQLGMSEIAMAAGYMGNDEFSGISRLEALFYLSFIDPDIKSGNAQDVAGILKDFEKQEFSFPDPSNPLYVFSKASILLRAHRNDDAFRSLTEYMQGNPEYRFCILDFMMGVARMNRLDPGAHEDFIRFLNEYHGRNNIRSAYQKLAWSYFLQGDTAKYREYIQRVSARGISGIEADKQAERESESGQLPNMFLLKARLLFDGGYYEKAFHVLLDRNLKEMLTSPKDLTEYHYRLGRLYQESGDTGKALTCYQMTVEEGRKIPYYFAASAALQSGLILEKKHDFNGAEKYFRLCLGMDYPEYKTSLDLKARAGLKRVRKNP